MSTYADLEERLVDFAVGVLALAELLPSTYAGQHIARQILRSGTSPAPNYAEARAAESRRDFVHKLRIAHKELNETRIWLHIIQRSTLLPRTRTETLRLACDELCRILGASIQTARQRRSSPVDDR
ncbi:MAG: four helix bundle protein [Bacteroidota bacterium]